MQTINNGYRSLSLLVDLNRDRMLYLSAIALSLGAASWITTTLGQAAH